MLPRSRLYPLLDLDCLANHRIEPLAAARELLLQRPFALQLRAKGRSPRETLAWLLKLAPLCEEADVPLIANDRPDLAWLAGTRAVHIGQQDLPLPEVQRLFAQLSIQGGSPLRVGISTHDQEQVERALVNAPDYLAFGPVFPTQSKEAPDPVVGLAGLGRAYEACQRAQVPLVAIGGITRERAPEVARTADVVAVISDLYSGGLSQVQRRAERYRRLLGELGERAPAW